MIQKKFEPSFFLSNYLTPNIYVKGTNMKVNKSRTTTTTCTCCWDKPKLAKSHQRDVLIDAKSWVHALIGLDTNGDCYHAHGTLTHSNVQELHATEGFVAVSQVIITPVLPQPSKGFLGPSLGPKQRFFG